MCNSVLLLCTQVLQECSLLGAIEGSDILEERKRSATETAKRPVDGKMLAFSLNTMY